MITNSYDSGVITGNKVMNMYKFAKNNNFAIPSINVFNSNSINSSIETAFIFKSPIIIQISHKTAEFNTGGIFKKNNIIYGSKIMAFQINKISKLYNIPVILNTDHCYKKNLKWIDSLILESKKNYEKFGKPIFSSHMIDLSKESLQENIEICSKFLEKMKKINIILEIELGITGGEEDGMDNTNVEKKRLYTTPDDVEYAYKELTKISSNFIIAANFGNIHGVYNNKKNLLNTNILKKSQIKIQKKYKTSKNPIFFVFHGGSGTSRIDIKKSIEYGVVKFNIDTDLQFAFLSGVRNYILNNNEYLKKQIGNPLGKNYPNKKYYDPRIWLREGELYFKKY